MATDPAFCSPTFDVPAETPLRTELHQRKRILFVDHTAKLGGGEIALLNLVTSIDQSRFEPIVVLFSDGPLAAELKKAAIDTRFCLLSSSILDARKDSLGLRTILKLGMVFRTIAFTIRLARFIKACRPDIVHTNSLKADIIGGFASRMAGVKVIWHVRDRISTDYLPRLVVVLFRRLARWIPTLIVANSASTLATLHLPNKLRGEAIYSGINLRERARIVHDGTQTPSTPASISNRQTASIIGLVGRISPWKGQHIFIEAAAKVRESFPNVLFKIVGAPLFDERQYEQQIHEQVRSLGLDNVVEFTGFRKDISSVVAGFDVLVHSSTSGEPFGQVVIEGMAASKPVVATNGGGIPEIVIDGVTGLLVPMGDSTSLAEAICHLLKNPEMARRMGQKGHARVLEHFTVELTVGRLEKLYSEMLAEKKSIDKARSRKRTRGVLTKRLGSQILASIAGPIGASFAAMGLDKILLTHSPRYSPFFAMILVIARWVNFPCAMLSLLISDAIICYLLLPPDYSFRIHVEDIPQFLTFNALIVFAASLIARLERSKSIAESARLRAEAAYSRASVLASASTSLAMCMDEMELCATLGRMAKNNLCDWCVIDLIDHARVPRRVYASHCDSNLNVLVRQLLEYPPEMNSKQLIAKTLRSGCVEFSTPTSAESLKEGVVQPAHLELLDRLASRAFMIVPLSARGTVLGTITLARAGEDKFFNSQDVTVAKELCIRASLTLENIARLQAAPSGN